MTISNARIYDDPDAPAEGDGHPTDSSAKVNDQGFVVSAAMPELRQNMAYTQLGKQQPAGGYEDEEEDDFDENARVDTAVGHALQKVSFMIAQDQVQVSDKRVQRLE